MIAECGLVGLCSAFAGPAQLPPPPPTLYAKPLRWRNKMSQATKRDKQTRKMNKYAEKCRLLRFLSRSLSLSYTNLTRSDDDMCTTQAVFWLNHLSIYAVRCRPNSISNFKSIDVVCAMLNSSYHILSNYTTHERC